MIMRSGKLTRILMTGDTVGGVWTYAMELCRAFCQAGVEVSLATMGRPASPQQRQEAAEIGGLQLFESSYRLPWMEQPWEDVRLAGEWLLDLAAHSHPDVIHLNEPVHGSLEWPAPVVAVAHSCVLSWWEAVLGTQPPPEWDVYQLEMGRGLRAADHVVAPSLWMLEAVRRFYGVTGGSVIANGRYASDLYPEPKQPLIFAAGRLWDRAKNLTALEQVAGEVAWPIYVAGEARHPDGNDHVTADQVRLLGQLPGTAIASWLRRASIYAFPAQYEPFGLSVLEAALAGCALVLGDLPTLRELWDGAAVFVAPDNPADLRLALKGLIDDPVLRQALAMRARRKALRLTPERMGRAYLQLYAGVLSTTRPHPETACAS